MAYIWNQGFVHVDHKRCLSYIKESTLEGKYRIERKNQNNQILSVIHFMDDPKKDGS